MKLTEMPEMPEERFRNLDKLILEIIVESSMIQRDNRYWDCNCKTDYIHLKDNEMTCEACGCDNEDDNAPDSSINEIATLSVEYVDIKTRLEHARLEHASYDNNDLNRLGYLEPLFGIDYSDYNSN